jgi:hypothetical protein
MKNFFAITLETLNLFSFMMGVTFVSLSSYWKGRLMATRLAFLYMAILIIFFAMEKK